MSTCVRCGRPLRSPSSIRRGAGPACAKLLLRQGRGGADATGMFRVIGRAGAASL
ncbi:DUF6011 domain-containing protein [Alicyclobacillus acidocaldarius]|uniref:DUF6011 domain-containing protein n=1 Tax=Alicyclobacillus acidocaldarius TaxID=405212 RepID=UPI0035BE760D